MNRKNIALAAKVTSVLILCVLALSSDIGAFAQTSGNYSVRAVIPDNQVDTRQTYFDLRMEPGAKQTVQVVIDNSRAEALTIKVQLNSASTGRNGLIIYSEPDVRDDSLEVAITDVAKLRQETVTVPASGSSTVYVDIEMPENELDGAVLGGIVVSEEKSENNTKAAEGVSLTNTITYVIGLKITENTNTEAPDFEFVSVAPGLVNYKTAVTATLRNNVPLIVKDMSVEAQVYRSGSDTPLHGLSLENAEMAPLSKGDFVINWDNTALEAGNYRLVMSAFYEGQEWKWDKEFTIDKANDINSGAVGLQRNYIWVYILAGVIVLIITAYIAYRQGKRKNAD